MLDPKTGTSGILNGPGGAITGVATTVTGIVGELPFSPIDSISLLEPATALLVIGRLWTVVLRALMVYRNQVC